MSQGTLGTLSWQVVVDDSQFDEQLATNYSKAQAHVERLNKLIGRDMPTDASPGTGGPSSPTAAQAVATPAVPSVLKIDATQANQAIEDTLRRIRVLRELIEKPLRLNTVEQKPDSPQATELQRRRNAAYEEIASPSLRPTTARPSLETPPAETRKFADLSNVPEFARQEIEQRYATGKRHGVVEDIERLSAQRKTSNEVAAEIAGRMGEAKPSEVREVVRGVRAKLGIPSMDDREEFEAWRAQYESRPPLPLALPSAAGRGGAGRRPPSEIAITSPDEPDPDKSLHRRERLSPRRETPSPDDEPVDIRRAGRPRRAEETSERATARSRETDVASDALARAIRSEARAHDDAADTTRRRSSELQRLTESRVKQEGQLEQLSREDLPPKERLQAVRDRMRTLSADRGPGTRPLPPGPNDPYFREYRQLQGEEESLTSVRGARGFVGRMGPIGAGYLIYRGLRGIAENITQDESIARVGALEGVSAQLGAERSRQEAYLNDPIRSRLNRGIGNIMGRFGISPRTREYYLGNAFNPEGDLIATVNAQRAITVEQQRSQIRVRNVQEEQQIGRTNREAATRDLPINAGLARRRREAVERYRSAMDADTLEAESLREQLKQAEIDKRPEDIARLTNEIQNVARQGPARYAARTRLLQSEQREITADVEQFRARLRAQVPVQQALAENQYGLAGERELVARREIERREADPEELPDVERDQQRQAAVHAAEVGEDIRRRGVRTDVLGLRARGRPREAEQRELDEQRKEALQNARYARLDIGGMFTPEMHFGYDERPGINAEFDARQQEMNAERQRASLIMDIGLAGQRESLQRSLAGDVIGAQSSQITTGAFERAESLRQQGFTSQAQQTLQNAVLQEGLLRQNYLESFRGEQMDLRSFNISNPRDVEDPNKVLEGLRSDVQRVEDAIRELKSD